VAQAVERPGLKVIVAAIERGDSRAMPQTPWPEVQPAP
jgi:hypothetical protein